MKAPKTLKESYEQHFCSICVATKEDCAEQEHMQIVDEGTCTTISCSAYVKPEKKEVIEEKSRWEKICQLCATGRN